MRKAIPGIQQVQSFQSELPKTVNKNYLLYLPKVYDRGQPKRWPLILFLHGAGQRGMWLWLVKVVGVAKIVRKRQFRDFPFIVVSPQCSSNSWWSNDALNMVLDEVTSKYNVDPDRIYVTGLSMGGFGAPGLWQWSILIGLQPSLQFVEGGNPARVCTIKHLPIWTFHGARDTTVPIKQTESMVEALKQCGGNVRFTVYLNAGHDAWTETYANPELYSWFLEHTRGSPTRAEQ